MRKFLMIAMVLVVSFAANSANANALANAKDVLRDEILNQSSHVIESENLRIDIQQGLQDLENSTQDMVMINSLEVEEKQNRFTAFLTIDGLIPVEVTGRYTEITSVPALKHKMSKKDIITEDDIVYVDIDTRKLARGYVIDESELIGKSPARTLFSSRAIPLRHVKAPDLVEERKAVTLYFKSGAIEMQDMGIAMESGAKGDFVRVRNASSDVIISGRVMGKNLVEVAQRGTVLASK